MADWKKLNFADVPDRSPEEVEVQFRFARNELESPELGVSRFTYEPGARMPWAHSHKEQQEAYMVVGGSGRGSFDGEIVDLVPWDVIRVAPSVVRSFEAGPDGLDIICIGGQKPEGGDGQPHPDPWE